MQGWFNSQVIFTVIRYLLSFVGGYIASRGWLSADEWVTISGAILTFLSAVWGVAETRRTKVVAHGVTSTPATVVDKVKIEATANSLQK